MTDQIDMALIFQALPRSIDPATLINSSSSCSPPTTGVKCIHSPASEGETRRTENTSVESLSNDHDQDEHCTSKYRYVERDILIPLELHFCPSESDGSVSSMSSVEDDTPRAIFPKHWQKSATGKVQVPKRRRPFPKTSTSMKAHPCHSSDESEDGSREAKSSSGNTYERTLLKREGIKPSPSEGNITRRRLFAGCMNHDSTKPVQRSNSCFAPVSTSMMRLSRRNAYSDSALVVRKLPSCLRSPQYSGDDPSRHLDRSQSVTFSNSATMVKYEIPQEQWAASGWSSYFY